MNIRLKYVGRRLRESVPLEICRKRYFFSAENDFTVDVEVNNSAQRWSVIQHLQAGDIWPVTGAEEIASLKKQLAEKEKEIKALKKQLEEAKKGQKGGK